MTAPHNRSRRASTRSAATAALVAGSLSVLSSFSLQAGPLDKNPVKNPNLVPVQEAHPMYLGTINTGVKGSDEYIDGNFSLVLPVWSTLGADSTLSGDVLYLEPYTSWGEGGEVAASLGLGWRHLFGSQPVSALSRKDAGQAGFFEEGIYIGGNFFVDMLDTEANNQFWQLGVGIEIGTRYVEVRGNYYIPLSDKQLAEETRTRDILRSSSSRDNTSLTPLNDPYATGNTIAQDGLWTTNRTTTTTTTTIDRLFRRYEEGMEGWDAEVAVLVPGLDKYFDLRLIGGYYSFDNQPFGPQTGGTGNVEGFKAGVEVRPVPAVILTGTWYEDDRLTGSDWTAGVQLQLPFELGDIGDGKGFWSRIGDSFKPRRRHLVERMAEPVHRQNAAIKVANSVDVDTTTSTKVKRVTKVISQRQGQIVLADDIVFVNNGDAVGNGIQAGDSESNGANGTAERPFDTITEGAVVAGNNSTSTSRLWNVYTQGSTGNTYFDDVDVVGSTRFISSYNAIPGIPGTKFGGNTDRPNLRGGFYAEDIETLIVTGYNIRRGYDWDDGIYAENVKNLTVNDNVFRDIDEVAVHVVTGYSGEHNVVVASNTFNEAQDEAFRLTANGGAIVNLEILSNTLLGQNEDDGFHIHARHGSEIYADIDGNLFDGDFEEGIHLDMTDGGDIFANITNNVFGSDFDDNVIRITADDNGDLFATISGNKFNGEVENGINVQVRDDAEAGLFILNNEFNGRFYGNALVFDADDGDPALYAVLVGNKLAGTFYDHAIEFNAESGSFVGAGIVENQFSGTFYNNAVDLQAEDGADLGSSIYDNVFSGLFYDNGISIRAENYSDVFVEVQGNTFSGFFSEGGITALAENYGDIELDILDNDFSGQFDRNAIRVEKTWRGDVELVIDSNRFSGDFEWSAVSLLSGGSSQGSFEAEVTNNVFSGDFDGTSVIRIVSEDYADLVADVTNNLLTATGTVFGDDFLYARASNNSSLTIQNFDSNRVLGLFARGFVFSEGSSASLNVTGTLNDNSVQNEVRLPSIPVSYQGGGSPAASFRVNGSNESN